eukprot:scaffold20515_cov117-Cylindrotheca_fusiformis.AAC.1
MIFTSRRVIFGKQQSNEWSLEDGHPKPPSPLVIQTLATRTLQYVGCWLSGKVVVKPTTKVFKKCTMATPRGLGAAIQKEEYVLQYNPDAIGIEQLLCPIKKDN